MTARAGASEDVFHEVFRSVEECYRAAYEQGLARLSQTVAEAAGREQGWLARVRSGLVAALGLFDDEPAWARLLLLEAPVDAGTTLVCTQQLQAVLTRLLDQPGEAGAPVDAPMLLPALTGELVVGGVVSVIRTSMLDEHGGRLVELAPSLVAFIAVQYGQSDLAGDLARRDELARAEVVSRTVALPIRATHRTTLVLRAIAHAPHSNNREIARIAGIADEGQTSKLLARLERQGVIENVGVGAARGEPNAWLLTAEGRRALELLGDSFPQRTARRSSRRMRGAL